MSYTCLAILGGAAGAGLDIIAAFRAATPGAVFFVFAQGWHILHQRVYTKVAAGQNVSNITQSPESALKHTPIEGSSMYSAT